MNERKIRKEITPETYANEIQMHTSGNYSNVQTPQALQLCKKTVSRLVSKHEKSENFV